MELAFDTDEVLANPLLGPLVRGALRVAAPSLDPAEVTPPIGKDPLLGLPTPVPVPRLERLYFQCGPLSFTLTLTLILTPPVPRLERLYFPVRPDSCLCMQPRPQLAASLVRCIDCKTG